MTVRSRKGNYVSPTKTRKSTVKSTPYTNPVKDKTTKSPKQPKPSSPTDHSMVSMRWLKHEVKIKQEFINRVDYTKWMAPICSSMSGKDLEEKDRLQTAHNRSPREEAYNDSSSHFQHRWRRSVLGEVLEEVLEEVWLEISVVEYEIIVLRWDYQLLAKMMLELLNQINWQMSEWCW